jgi:hypothetical protein
MRTNKFASRQRLQQFQLYPQGFYRIFGAKIYPKTSEVWGVIGSTMRIAGLRRIFALLTGVRQKVLESFGVLEGGIFYQRALSWVEQKFLEGSGILEGGIFYPCASAVSPYSDGERP